MCDPVIAGGAMLAMSGIQAYTQYQQGKYASKVAEANADIATAQANDAINRVTLKLSNGAERPDSGLVHRRRQWGDRRRFIYR